MNPELIAARWYFGDLNPEEWPNIACDFLERGSDGKCLRILAGLSSPTRADIAEVVTCALVEMGTAAPISRDTAGLILAKHEAKCMLRDGRQPHEIASRVWHIYGFSVPELKHWRDLHQRYMSAESRDTAAAAEAGILAAAKSLASD